MDGEMSQGLEAHPAGPAAEPLAIPVNTEDGGTAAFAGIVIAVLGTLAVSVALLTSMIVFRVIIAVRRRRHFQAALAAALAGGRVAGWGGYAPDLEAEAALHVQGVAGEGETLENRPISGAGGRSLSSQQSQQVSSLSPPPQLPKLPTIVVHPDGTTVDFAVKDAEIGGGVGPQGGPSDATETGRGRDGSGEAQLSAANDSRPPMGPSTPLYPYMDGYGTLEGRRHRRHRRARPPAAPPPLVIVQVPLTETKPS